MKKEKFEYIQKNSHDIEAMSKMSRRDLLEAGVITFAARLVLPSFAGTLATLIAEPSKAQESIFSSSVDWASFITVNLEGGASLHGNILARDVGGNLLNSYTYHGLGAVPSSPVQYFGLTFDIRSKMLAGFRSVVSSGAAAGTVGTVLCTNTDADTRAIAPLRPQFDLAAAVESTGRKGGFFSSLEFEGNLTSLRSFHDNSPNSRLSVTASSQVLDALSLTASFASQVKVGSTSSDRFSKEQKRSLASLLGKLTQRQLSGQSQERYLKNGAAQVAAANQLQDIVAGEVSGRDLVDPRKNAVASELYSLSSSTVTDAQLTKAAVVYSSVMGYSSSSYVHLGGYDYHFPNTREFADNKDFEAGVEIGRMIELAHRLKKPVFIFVATDGSNFSISSDTNTSQWASDTKSAMQLILAYSPKGFEVSKNGFVGHYLNDGSQAVDSNTLVGSRSDYVAAAVMANYLSMHGQISQLTKVAPSTITNDRVDEVVRIFKKA